MRNRLTGVLLLAVLTLAGCHPPRLRSPEGEGRAGPAGPVDAPRGAEPERIPTPSDTPPSGTEPSDPAAAESPSAEPATAELAPTEGRDEEILERARRVLDSVERGAFVEADEEIGRFQEAHQGYEPAELLARFLRSHLDRALAASSLEAPETSDFWRANEKLVRARELVAVGRDAAARDLLEEAHAADPENPDVAEALLSVLKRLGLDGYSRGETAKATELWRRALELRAEDEELRRFLQRAEAVTEKP